MIHELVATARRDFRLVLLDPARYDSADASLLVAGSRLATPTFCPRWTMIVKRARSSGSCEDRSNAKALPRFLPFPTLRRIGAIAAMIFWCGARSGAANEDALSR